MFWNKCVWSFLCNSGSQHSFGVSHCLYRATCNKGRKYPTIIRFFFLLVSFCLLLCNLIWQCSSVLLVHVGCSICSFIFWLPHDIFTLNYQITGTPTRNCRVQFHGRLISFLAPGSVFPFSLKALGGAPFSLWEVMNPICRKCLGFHLLRPYVGQFAYGGWCCFPWCVLQSALPCFSVC